MRLFHAAALVVVLFAGCSGGGASHEENLPVGWMERSVLDGSAYSQFKAAYDSIHIGDEFVEIIRNNVAGINVTVFFGVWCPDSRRDVPRFLRLADLAGIPGTQVKLYSLDRSKKSGDGLTEYYGIERVPTFIFFKNGEEIGRIVETPKTTIEGDILAILAGTQ